MSQGSLFFCNALCLVCGRDKLAQVACGGALGHGLPLGLPSIPTLLHVTLDLKLFNGAVDAPHPESLADLSWQT